VLTGRQLFDSLVLNWGDNAWKWSVRFFLGFTFFQFVESQRGTGCVKRLRDFTAAFREEFSTPVRFQSFFLLMLTLASGFERGLVDRCSALPHGMNYHRSRTFFALQGM